MGNFELINIPNGSEKMPTPQAPVLDEQQIEDNENLEDLLEKKSELEERMEEGEDVNFEYQLLIEKIVKQLQYNYENNISDGWKEESDEVKNNKKKVSKEERIKKEEEEKQAAIERYRNGLDKLYERDGTERPTDI